MSRKALRVQVQLDLQAVTCPGVWLCPNGKVSLQLYMLDSCVQTNSLPPVFPLLYHEQFIFYKIFYSAKSLLDLQKYMDKVFLYAELVQWQHDNVGNVIASFQTSLQEVLYPSSSEGIMSGIDIDLLMEPSKNFPGIISPKIEISTRTTVEEIVCNSRRKTDNYVVNPKTIPSNYISSSMKRKCKLPHQKRVCHSLEYYKNKACISSRKPVQSKPPFVYRKAEEGLISRKPQGIIDNFSRNYKCRTCLELKKVEIPSQILDQNPSKLLRSYSFEIGRTTGNLDKRKEPCTCESSHTGDSCPLCTKYSSYFDSGRSINQINECSTKCGDNFVCKLNKICPLKEEISKRSCRYSNISNKTRPRSPAFCNSNESRHCELDPLTKKISSDARTCTYCSESRKSKTAKQIHRRIKTTLCCNDNYNEECEPSLGSASDCCTSRFRSCEQGFYKDLGKCYRDL